MKKFGKLFIVLGIIAAFAGCKNPTDEIVELTEIEVTVLPDKTEYFVGEELDTTGLKVTATYSDESKQIITDWTITGYDKTKIGKQTVKVSYTKNEITITASFTVTVKAIEITKIEVTALPNKTEYFSGEELDTTGLEVTATYNDNSTKDVTADITTSGFDSSVATDSQTITVTYDGKTATFTVKIIPVLTGIEITSQPTKTVYIVGEELDTTGLEVTATYSDNSTKDVTAEVTTSGFDSSIATDNQTITVTYGGKTATFTVKINPILTGIEITTEPTKKEYYTGDSLDLTGMVVTATYNNGSTADVTDKVTTSGFDSSSAVDSQTITVTYGGQSAIFTVKIIKPQPYSFHDTVTVLPEGTTGSYGTDATYVEFGDWPQDVVPVADVTTLGLETSTDKVNRGYMVFVKGIDGNYYVKCNEKRYNSSVYDSSYKYTKDGSTIGTGSRWFKVMPIKWRVADSAYKDASGSAKGKLLVAENILTANVSYYKSDRNRTISDSTVYANNYIHSQIRAFLNGLTYTGYDSNSRTNVEETQWESKGFLQTAFTSEAIDKIITTKVDNAKEQMSYNGINFMEEDYACDPTDDKIFLLSEKEVVQYSKSGEEWGRERNSWIRVTTDFAKANYAWQSTTDGWGGYWWLRSPHCGNYYYARDVFADGCSTGQSFDGVYWKQYGVVPALSISF